MTSFTFITLRADKTHNEFNTELVLSVKSLNTCIKLTEFNHILGYLYDYMFVAGNSKLAMMTTQRQYELRIDLENYSGEKAFAKYSSFSIGDESTKYKLTVAGYSGTAGDSLNVHNNQPFSTNDSDNDQWGRNCAAYNSKGAWWYNACHNSNLNGLYGNTGFGTGMAWYHWKNNYQSMKTTSMMIRRKRT